MDRYTIQFIFAIIYGLVLGLIFGSLDLPMWSEVTSIIILAFVGNFAFSDYLKKREEAND